MVDLNNYENIKKDLPEKVKLVAVSKTKPAEDILSLYRAGQRIFGENKAQELKNKYEVLPKDIQWHFIGHLQSNKIKYIAPFIGLIHSIDSFRLLKEVNKYAEKNGRVIPCLIQFHIAREETKFGFTIEECEKMLSDPSFHKLQNIEIQGIMGMATFTDDTGRIRNEFRLLHAHFLFLKEKYFPRAPYFSEISMGMTDDYKIALEEGSTIIRIGSAIFGKRNYIKQNDK